MGRSQKKNSIQYKKLKSTNPFNKKIGIYLETPRKGRKQSYHISPYKLVKANEGDTIHLALQNGKQIYGINQVIHFSQNNISNSTQDDIPLEKLAKDMQANGWLGLPIRASFIKGRLTTLDHRRVIAAIAAGVQIVADISNSKYETQILKRMDDNDLKEPSSRMPTLQGNLHEVFTSKEFRDRFQFAAMNFGAKGPSCSEVWRANTKKLEEDRPEARKSLGLTFSKINYKN